jgi:hypothetical protein
VTPLAEYRTGRPVYAAVDAGVSRYTGAIFFQAQQRDAYRKIVSVFGDYLAVDQTSEENAQALKSLAYDLPCRGLIDGVKLDPAANAQSSLGPAARGEYERVFGDRIVSSWPMHRVSDGLDQLEFMIGGPKREPDLLIHPRCKRLIDALKTYRHNERRGEIMDEPAPVQHPAEDLCDALRVPFGS